MNVYLIGMPGAGKSTVGKVLAHKLGRNFVDLDIAIEKMAGLSIPEIFEKHGETYFRQLESEALKTVSFSTEKLVVATGGGTPCFFDNLAFMQTQGLVLYLKVSPETLAERLLALTLNSRPLLKEKSKSQLLMYLNQTLVARSPFYEKAGIILEADTVAKTVEASLQQLFRAENPR